MKILIYLENLHRGGVDTFIINLINFWPKKNDKFIILSNKNHPAIDYIKLNIGNKHQVIPFNIPLYNELIKKIPNIFITKIALRVSLLIYQYFLLKRILIKIRANALIVANGGYPGGDSSRLANIVWKRLGNSNNIHNVHNLAVEPKGFLISKFENIFDLLLQKSVDNFVCVSKVSLKYLRKRKNLSQIKNITYIYHGLNSKKKKSNIILRKLIKIKKDEKICLVLATYERRKGHFFLIKAFKEALKIRNDLHLVFAGHRNKNDESYFNNLKTFKNDKIHFLDFVPLATSLITQSDIVLIGSQEYESFGLVALEAMMLKIPVITTNLEAFKEVLGKENSENVIQKNNHKSFSNQIIKILNDKKYKNKSIEKGYKRANTLFNPSEMSLKYYNLITFKK